MTSLDLSQHRSQSHGDQLFLVDGSFNVAATTPQRSAFSLDQTNSPIMQPIKAHTGERLDNLGTTSQKLLGHTGTSSSGEDSPRIIHSHPNGNDIPPYADPTTYDSTLVPEHDPKWLPLPLRPWFWMPFIAILVLGAIGLEIALHFSKVNKGWPSSASLSDTENVLHYVYTLPPVAAAAILVALWTWTDIEIKKMQPYVDLVHGDSPPHRSLLLDYTRHNNFFVWTRAAANKHYLVALASLMVLLSLAFQPLAAALLTVRNTWFAEPGHTVNNLAALSLNQDLQFEDLTSFLTASGFAGASILYSLGDPPFIHGQYTIGRFEMPTSVAKNGTVITNTTAVKSDPGCQPVPVTMTQVTDGWQNSVSFNDCSVTWNVSRNASSLFGTDIPTCNPDILPQFSPIILWFFTYETTPVQATATFCTPRFELWDVTASVDIATRNVTAIQELRPFSSSSNFSSLAANLTGPPLNGRAYNGIRFNLTNPDQFVLRRLEALQLQLPAAVYQAAVQSPDGLLGNFDPNKFVNLAGTVYRSYLTLIASTVYFLPHTEPMTVEVRTFRQRVWLSDVAVHLLAAAMLILAVFGTFVQLLHRYDRRQLRLKHQPGTIASAVSIGARTGMGELLAGQQREDDIYRVLRDKRFRIDPKTMRIVMEGEEGYDVAVNPMERRRTIFSKLYSQ